MVEALILIVTFPLIWLLKDHMIHSGQTEVREKWIEDAAAALWATSVNWGCRLRVGSTQALNTTLKPIRHLDLRKWAIHKVGNRSVSEG